MTQDKRKTTSSTAKRTEPNNIRGAFSDSDGFRPNPWTPITSTDGFRPNPWTPIPEPVNPQPTPSFDPSTISHWTLEASRHIPLTPETTFPKFDITQIKALSSDMNIWDTWMVLDESGNIAKVRGFNVLIALGHHSGVDNPRLVYFYTSDNLHYHFGGDLLPERLVKGCQEWSGCSILRRDGRLQTFYTISQHADDSSVDGNYQRIATAIQAPWKRTGQSGHLELLFDRPSEHKIIMEPDGRYYQTFDQMVRGESQYPNQHDVSKGSDRNNNFCFRDPCFFRDPKTGAPYLLFEANTGSEYYPEGDWQPECVSDDFTSTMRRRPTTNELKANGCVGMARLEDYEYTEARMLPPLLTSSLATDEIERINLMYIDDYYYLFFTTRGAMMSTTNPDLMHRNMMIGFRSQTLRGGYKPLNGNGVVIQQHVNASNIQLPLDDPQYVYSWFLLPNSRVLTYAWHATNDAGETYVKFTAGPSAVLAIEGDRTYVTGVDYNIQPAKR